MTRVMSIRPDAIPTRSCHGSVAFRKTQCPRRKIYRGRRGVQKECPFVWGVGAIDKDAPGAAKCRQATVSRQRANRECGAERKFPSRSCPRNCKRQVRATVPLEQSGKAVTDE